MRRAFVCLALVPIVACSGESLVGGSGEGDITPAPAANEPRPNDVSEGGDLRRPADGGGPVAPDGGASARDGSAPAPDASSRDASPNDAVAVTPEAGACSVGVNEVEPNDSAAAANALASGVCGTVAGADADYFAFDAQGLVRVQFTATADARVTLTSPGGSAQTATAPATLTSFAALSGKFVVRVQSPTGAAQSYTVRRQ